MFEDTNKQALVSFSIPPVDWQLSITTTHQWYINLTSGTRTNIYGRQAELSAERRQ